MTILFNLATQKSFTSSSCNYIAANYCFRLIDEIKESHFLNANEKKKLKKNINYIDGSQGYIYNKNFIDNLGKLKSPYKIIITINSIYDQYERLFNMYYEQVSLKDNFNLEKIFLNSNLNENFNEIRFHSSFKNIKLFNQAKKDLKKYKIFVNRDITDLEVTFFIKNEYHVLFNNVSKEKIKLLIYGDIKKYLQFEIKQLRSNNWLGINILPNLLVPYIYNWLLENKINKKLISVIKFQDSLELKKKN